MKEKPLEKQQKNSQPVWTESWIRMYTDVRKFFLRIYLNGIYPNVTSK